jgi:hypothetical protein
MMGLRRFVSVLSSLAAVCGLLLSAAPVSAATQSTGLSVAVARPGVSWQPTIATAPGETINVLITYKNMNNRMGQKNVFIQDVLPTGATFKPGSAYLFAPGGPGGGIQQKDTLTTSDGIGTGHLVAGATAFIQFQMFMPADASLACGRNVLTNQAKGHSNSGNETYMADARIIVNRACTPTVSPTPTQTPNPTPTPTAPTPTSTSVSVVSIDASETTNVNNTFNTSTPQVAGASTAASSTTTANANEAGVTTAVSTTSSQPVATQDVSNAKTLVNTGPGNIIVIFLLATIVGAVGSRFVLYRLLGA